MARMIRASEHGIVEKAAGELAAGRLVAIPTETVYGLAADATDGEAVAAIFAAKGRPRFNPLIAHVSGLEMAERIGVFDRISVALALHFWPGPLTLVVPLKPGAPVHPLVSAGNDTVAVRCPRGIAREVIERLDRPVAAPSANRSGKITATTAEDVERDLGDSVALIVDGGQTAIGLESTIVKSEGAAVRLLRPGGVAVAEIEALGIPVVRGAAAGAVEAPGMLASHYAPDAALRLNADEVRPGEALLEFGPKPVAGAENAVLVLNLSESGDLTEAAVNLFSHLHRLDASGAKRIAVAPVPAHGLGEAINDRLARAAAPRDSDAEQR